LAGGAVEEALEAAEVDDDAGGVEHDAADAAVDHGLGDLER
jgi:hypothetical protein